MAGLWATRARFEREAEARFRRLASDLASVGAPTAVVDLAQRAADDEARHHILCVEAGRRFGGPEPESTPVHPDPVAPSGLTRRDRALYDATALCAVMETVSAAMLHAMLDTTTDAALRATVQAVLADEIDHARIGWAHLAFERERGPVDIVGRWLPTMLAGTVPVELFDRGPVGPLDTDIEPYGGLRRSTRRAVFVSAVRDLLIPGLHGLGVPTAPALGWLDARG